jgi:hypothetical protein
MNSISSSTALALEVEAGENSNDSDKAVTIVLPSRLVSGKDC